MARSLLGMATLVMVISGCAAPVSGPPAPGTATVTPSQSADASTSGAFFPPTAPPLFAPPVREPKDARGIPACDLLTDDQLRQLGLAPGSDRPTSTGGARSCTWMSAVDDTNPAGLDVLDESPTAPLDFVYRLRESTAIWEELEIAGHPAVLVDEFGDNDCTVYVAIADYQAFSTVGNVARRDLPDPCDLSRRMAELILSNLPPLR